MVIQMNNSQDNQQKPTFRTLSKEEARVILEKGTERPWTGKYTNLKEKGSSLESRVDFSESHRRGNRAKSGYETHHEFAFLNTNF